MIRKLRPAPAPGRDLSAPEERLRLAGDAGAAGRDAAVAEIIREAVDVLGPDDASILDLHLRHGLDHEELAAELGVVTGAREKLESLCTRLDRAVHGRVLWEGGNPRCSRLAGLLAGADAFSRGTADLIDAHAETCATCSDGRVMQVAPTAVFAALPACAAPEGMKVSVASALAAAGVPMGGSRTFGERDGNYVTQGSPDVHNVPPWARDAVTHDRRSGKVARAVLALAAVFLLLGGIGIVVAGQLRSGTQESPVALSGAVTTGPAGRSDDVSDGSRGQQSGPPPSTSLPPTRSPLPKPRPDRAPATTVPGEGKGDRGDDAATPDEPEPGGTQKSLLAQGPRIVSFGASGGAISWKVSGEGSARVSGPGLSSSSMSGSKRVCPGAVVDGECAARGSFTYKITVYDPQGRLTDSRTVTVRMGQ